MTGAAIPNVDRNDQSSGITFPIRHFRKEFLTSLGVATVVTSIAVLLVGVISNIHLSDPLDTNIANAFLGTVAEVIAGTVAIVFTVSTLAVSIAIVPN